MRDPKNYYFSKGSDVTIKEFNPETKAYKIYKRFPKF